MSALPSKRVNVELWGSLWSQLLLLQDADGDLLAKPDRLGVVATPVDAGHVAADEDVGRRLVQLAPHGQRQPPGGAGTSAPPFPFGTTWLGGNAPSSNLALRIVTHAPATVA